MGGRGFDAANREFVTQDFRTLPTDTSSDIAVGCFVVTFASTYLAGRGPVQHVDDHYSGIDHLALATC